MKGILVMLKESLGTLPEIYINVVHISMRSKNNIFIKQTCWNLNSQTSINYGKSIFPLHSLHRFSRVWTFCNLFFLKIEKKCCWQSELLDFFHFLIFVQHSCGLDTWFVQRRSLGTSTIVDGISSFVKYFLKMSLCFSRKILKRKARNRFNMKKCQSPK